MASHILIDAQFDRAVEIVQGLPKTGPIQTDYEEKLQMYSLYKQATVGNVKSPRPGIWDMLGRAKWDAWAKHKDLESYEAKWLYVEALLKVLKRYSDKTVAQNLVRELESYGGDPSNLVLSQGTLMQSPDSESSGSTTSHDVPFESIQSLKPLLPHLPPQYTHDNAETTSEDEGSTDGEAEDDEVHNLRTFGSHVEPHRPHSSASTSARRYRTPAANSLLSQTPTGVSSIPAIQPLPPFQTPSAFPAPTPSTPGSVYNVPARPNLDPMHLGPHFRPHSQPPPRSISAGRNHSPARPASRMILERAVENVQAHLAALTERLAVLESRSIHNSALNSHHGSPQRASYSYEGGLTGSGRLLRHGSSRTTWDLNDLGMWSYILKPIYRALSFLYKSARFFASDESRSPTKMVIRRLCLDLSFLLCVIAILGAFWRKSGVRRREVKVALVVLGRAMAGNRAPISLSERGVKLGTSRF